MQLLFYLRSFIHFCPRHQYLYASDSLLSFFSTALLLRPFVYSIEKSVELSFPGLVAVRNLLTPSKRPFGMNTQFFE